jgi:hypothetical protein
MSSGPIILCDKSSVQALGPKQLNCLRRYFFLNVPPVLLVEILGDLKKPSASTMGAETVRGLARKMVPACSMVNVDFRHLIQNEMEGGKVPMRGCPVIASDRWLLGPKGDIGTLVEEQPEAAAVMRWQLGQFHEAEMLLAEGWRAITKGIDLEAMRNELRPVYSKHLNLRTLESVREHVDSVIASAPAHSILAWFLRDINVPPHFIIPAIDRFLKAGPGTWHSRAPFTHHCVRVALIFHFALAFGLIGTRSTNRIDMEYLFYLPFCFVFSSGDDLHRQLAPLLLKPDQMFLDREELHADFNQLAAKVEGLSEDELNEDLRRLGPPEDENSITHRIWQKFMRPDYAKSKRLSLTPEQERRLVEEAIRHAEGPSTSAPTNEGPLPQGQFAIRRFTMAFDGPCFCGSPRKFRDCCGKKLHDSQSTS